MESWVFLQGRGEWTMFELRILSKRALCLSDDLVMLLHWLGLARDT